MLHPLRQSRCNSSSKSTCCTGAHLAGSQRRRKRAAGTWRPLPRGSVATLWALSASKLPTTRAFGTLRMDNFTGLLGKRKRQVNRRLSRLPGGWALRFCWPPHGLDLRHPMMAVGGLCREERAAIGDIASGLPREVAPASPASHPKRSTVLEKRTNAAPMLEGCVCAQRLSGYLLISRHARRCCGKDDPTD